MSEMFVTSSNATCETLEPLSEQHRGVSSQDESRVHVVIAKPASCRDRALKTRGTHLAAESRVAASMAEMTIPKVVDQCGGERCFRVLQTGSTVRLRESATCKLLLQLTEFAQLRAMGGLSSLQNQFFKKNASSRTIL